MLVEYPIAAFETPSEKALSENRACNSGVSESRIQARVSMKES